MYIPEKIPAYLKRWDIAVQEDNAISLNQQRGVRSVYRKPGRYSKIEFGTHNFNNWLLSKMLDGQAGWDAGQRIFFEHSNAFSNDNSQMLMLAAETQKVQELYGKPKQ